MKKILLIYLFLILLSPIIVLFDKDKFTISGWMAIGEYNFDLIDGIYRSLYFFIVTSPVIIALYLGAPKFQFTNNVKTILISDKKYITFILFIIIIFSLVSWIFDLGINGFEKDTGIWRLSGIAFYIKSYISVIFISIYIFQRSKPSFLLIFIYSLILGYTSASRFTAVTPLILYLIRYIIESNGNVKFDFYLIVLIIFLVYSIITYIRVIFYNDDYTFSKTILFFEEFVVNRDQNFFGQGFSQLFLRIGIGRDVILAYEISQKCNCHDYVGLFFRSGSCTNPPYDFYGLSLESNRFYLAQPQLSSLFIISNNALTKICISFLYSLETFILCKIITKISAIPFGNILIYPLYFFVALFVLIGPISYAIYVCIFVIFVVFCYRLLKKVK